MTVLWPKEENLPVHIIVDYSLCEEPVIVTAYVPDSRYWLKYKTRKTKKVAGPMSAFIA